MKLSKKEKIKLMQKEQIGLYRKQFVIATLRRACYRWFAREDARRSVKVERGIYKCAGCKKNYARKDTRMDHISPVVRPDLGFISWDSYIQRMFVGPEGWQVLCTICHMEKTKYERKQRSKARQ